MRRVIFYRNLFSTVLLAGILLFPQDAFPQEKSLKADASLVQGGTYLWYNGDREMRVHLTLDEAALFRDPAFKLSAAEVEATLQRSYPEARIIKSNDFVAYVELPLQSDKSGLEEKISALKQEPGFRKGSPVFYPTRTKTPYSRMALTGEIIIHFSPDWDKKKIASWAKARGLTWVKNFSFAPQAYLFGSPEGLESLELANEIYRSGEVVYAYPNWLKTMSPRALPDDTLFDDQWHLRNTGQGGGTAGEDVNVETAWDTYRGSANEVIAIVDDGLEIGHEDLSPNVLAGYSWDYVGWDTDPSPGKGDDHGTAVAGVAAARGFNALGVCGAAPGARLVGHRLLGAETDVNEADALTRNKQILDVYSNSWGPYDDGMRLEGPGPLTEAALADGTANGRGGLGNIYVWAGGNGYDADNANYDGYANSRYTIAVAASTNYGVRSSYSEKGANILVNAPSNGGTLGITTTDRSGPGKGYDPSSNYTDIFGGTSSSTPLASGIIALMLEANPYLTWRDVQQILATTAEQNNPADPDWTINGAGYPINHKYGFGRVDAQAAVTAAEAWTNVGPELLAEGSSGPNLPIPDDDPVGVSDTINILDDISVEYVEIYFSAADHPYWGDLRVELTSPEGTTSILAEGRHNVYISYAYDNWRFGSVRHLGESAQGTWTLTVKDIWGGDTGTFQSWGLKIYGEDKSFYILNMTRMPWHENEESYYTGAATCQMILDYIREGAGVSGLTQNEIYNYAHANPGDNLDLTPDEVDLALGHFDPYDSLVSNDFDWYDSLPDGNPYQGYNYTVDSYDSSFPDALTDYLRDICHWMDYEVTREEWWKDGNLVAYPHTPAAVPIYGDYNWVAVKGFAASADPCPEPHTNPWNTPDFTVYGFWLKDPLVSGMGKNKYATADECIDIYFKPLNTSDVYSGTYLQVAEPPARMSTARVEIATPIPDSRNIELVKIAGGELEAESELMLPRATARDEGTGELTYTVPKKKDLNWKNIVDPFLLTDREATEAFQDTRPGKPILVHRLDGENKDYYLIPYHKEEEAEPEGRGRLTSAVIILDAQAGYFKEASWVKEPIRFMQVSKQKAIKLVLSKNPHLKRGKLDVELVWEPAGISQSPFSPYWMISSVKEIYFVTQSSEVIKK